MLFEAALLAQGLFFFAFQAKSEGRMTQEYDTTTERKLWFSGGSERPENCPVDSFQRRMGGSPGTIGKPLVASADAKPPL